MIINIVSDLHPDTPGNAIGEWPTTKADAVLVAGDLMSPGSHGLRMLRKLYPDTSVPLITVAGNHDFYSEGDPKKLKVDPTLKTTFAGERARMREEAERLGIVFLDDSEYRFDGLFDGLRVLGGCLWTDGEARPPYMPFTEAAHEAEKKFSDYRCTKTGAGRSKDKLTFADTVAAHRVTRRFLEEKLAEPFDGETIVLTHHAPSYRSLASWDPAMPKSFGYLDWLFASDLEYLMTGPNAPILWIHGHVHSKKDFLVGRCRILCNPRGYPPEPGHRHRENPKFDPGFVVKIERPSLTMRVPR